MFIKFWLNYYVYLALYVYLAMHSSRVTITLINRILNFRSLWAVAFQEKAIENRDETNSN